MTPRPAIRACLPACLPACLLAAALTAAPARAAPDAGPGARLLARHAELGDALARSPFGRPLVLSATNVDSAPHGEVHAVLRHPFAALAQTLQQAQSWCDILLLQTNIKRCRPAGEAQDARLEVGVARRYTDAVGEAHPVSFRYRVQAARADHLVVDMAAAQGPVGTHNYRLRFEAVPLDADRTFVHLSYAYETGLAARLATSAYLATSGRDKVGFSTTGRDAQGRPTLVRGIQGVAERNTMRYFLAIESFLATLSAPPPQRTEQRLRHFHAALERYPLQLHETEQAEYLAMKRRETQ